MTLPSLGATAWSALAAAALAVFGVCVGTFLVAPGAQAATSASGGTVTVSQTTGLDPAGQTITVTGSGFNEEQGIYISVCVDNGPDEKPTPCLGGVDTEGTSGSSQWVSSNPPPYAEGLTIPYGPGGSFEVTVLAVGSYSVPIEGWPDGIDCQVVACSLVTRADHTAPDDRSQDTRTPLTFDGPVATTTAPTTAPATTAPATTAPATTAAPTTPAAESTTDTEPSPVAAESSTPAALWIGLALAAAAAVVGTTAYVVRRRSTTGSATQ